MGDPFDLIGVTTFILLCVGLPIVLGTVAVFMDRG